MSHEPLIVLEAVERCLLHDSEHFYRIVAGRLPQIGIKAAKKVNGIGFPTPPEVVGNTLEGCQFLG